MADNKLIYNPDLGITYIMSPDGKTQIGHLEGDHRGNPAALSMAQPGGFNPENDEQPYTQNSIKEKMKQMEKDFVVNIASTIPMMAGPELGFAARALTSMGLGSVLDKILNPDRSATQSATQGAVNTAAAAIPEIGSDIKISAPPLLSEGGKGATFGKWGALTRLIPRLAYEPDPLAEEPKTLSEKLGEVPPPQTRGPKGRFLKQADIDAAVAAHKAAVKDIVSGDIMERLKMGGKGLALNELIDQTINRPGDKVDINKIPQQPVPTQPVTVDINKPSALNTPPKTDDKAAPTAQEIQDEIRAEALKQELPPELALAVARQESGFRINPPNAGKGAIGLFQLMPKTAEGLGVDPNDMHDNIRGGVKYLKQLYEKYGGDVVKTLIAYNAGPGVANKLPAETTDYVHKILPQLVGAGGQ